MLPLIFESWRWRKVGPDCLQAYVTRLTTAIDARQACVDVDIVALRALHTERYAVLKRLEDKKETIP